MLVPMNKASITKFFIYIENDTIIAADFNLKGFVRESYVFESQGNKLAVDKVSNIVSYTEITDQWGIVVRDWN